MTERPILFSGPMIRAILDGRKTMTRRVIDPQPHWVTTQPHGTVMMMGGKCGLVQALSKYGTVGDRLWVRETWAAWPAMNVSKPSSIYPQPVHYQATYDPSKVTHLPAVPNKWRPSIFMPRWASRITLEITSVKVERVQDISEEDAKAEGVEAAMVDGREYGLQTGNDYKWAFNQLWDSINAKRGYGWDVNPWVWALTLRRVS